MSRLLRAFIRWLRPTRPTVYEADWEGLVRAVDVCHGPAREWAWHMFGDTKGIWSRPHIARVVRDAYEGHGECCDAEVFALSAEVEVYQALQKQGAVL
jgi:hypothetical protein